ncbi:hypothetical protein [Nocardia sp. NPDC052112]|uniref:hypothetical protein n=1 Tax=Nocardia sp. NPDC052112 TaxID=3155646 RepID=UPI0034266E4C
MNDLKRPSTLGLILMPVLVVPFALVVMLVRPSFRRVVHDGFISMLRAYSRSAFVALGRAVDPTMSVEFLPLPFRFGPNSATLVSSRPDATPVSHSGS